MAGVPRVAFLALGVYFHLVHQSIHLLCYHKYDADHVRVLHEKTAKKGESCVLKYTSPCPTDGVMITIDAMNKGNRHTRICNIKEDNVECVCRKDRCNSIDNIVAAVKAAPDWEMNRYMKEDLLGCLNRIKDARPPRRRTTRRLPTSQKQSTASKRLSTIPSSSLTNTTHLLTSTTSDETATDETKKHEIPDTIAPDPVHTPDSHREGSESGVAESDLLTGPTMMIVVIVLAVILLTLISIVILVVVCSYRKKNKKKKNVKK